jgi:hypothetical protein
VGWLPWSKRLARLRDYGLVASGPAGRASLFRLAHPELLGLLASAGQLPAVTGNAAALCPAYGAAPGGEWPESHGAAGVPAAGGSTR